MTAPAATPPLPESAGLTATDPAPVSTCTPAAADPKCTSQEFARLTNPPGCAASGRTPLSIGCHNPSGDRKFTECVANTAVYVPSGLA